MTMYQRSFPICPVDGPRDPVPYKRGMMTGSIPKKCSTCQFFEQGMCSRGVHLTDSLLHLDHGPCFKDGNTDPEPINLPDVWPFQQIVVPYKCTSCPKLMADGNGGVICTDDSDVLGGFPRGVDWGKFRPDHPVVGVVGYTLDRNTILLEASGNRNQAVRSFKALNPKVGMKQAMDIMSQVRAKLMMASSQDGPGGPFW